MIEALKYRFMMWLGLGPLYKLALALNERIAALEEVVTRLEVNVNDVSERLKAAEGIITALVMTNQYVKVIDLGSNADEPEGEDSDDEHDVDERLMN